jgi:pimeloyl-ACP methyl ester carboxylesterase
MNSEARVLRGGQGEALLVLLHGLGATADVWDAWGPVLAARWPGRWLAPDLPGHGRSAALTSYSFDGLAAEVARAVPAGPSTVVFGHSLGGAVALALAAGGFGVPVAAVVGLGIKVEWTEEELVRARGLAERPVAWYPTRDEAAARYLRVAGLVGLVDPGDPAVDEGLSERDGQWRLAMDPAAFGVGAPEMAALLARCPAPVLLARGENDPMNTDAQLDALGVPTATLPGLGHNAHVESPEQCVELVLRVFPDPPARHP